MRIVRAGIERIDDLQPLWESLHEHHATVAPHLEELGPVRTPDQSWSVRRELYEEWLSEPDAFVLLAEVNREPIGYALVHLRGPEETWQTGDRIGVLETLAVLPDARGRGVGTALFERIYAELRELGVKELQVAVISKNAEALRFYERHGLLPFTVSYMGRVRD
jgi:ribosomal protein S18 acetylase RimI-like enzyme